MPLFEHVHPRVAEAVFVSIKACKHARDFVAVKAYVDQTAQKCLAEGAEFVNVGDDVSILAQIPKHWQQNILFPLQLFSVRRLGVP